MTDSRFFPNLIPMEIERAIDNLKNNQGEQATNYAIVERFTAHYINNETMHVISAVRLALYIRLRWIEACPLAAPDMKGRVNNLTTYLYGNSEALREKLTELDQALQLR